MQRLPKLAIVGRPNVGKSALFNVIAGKRIAIVDEAEGITRDRLYADTTFFGRPFEVIDTGGINAKSKDAFNEHILQQAEIAIEEADTIVMVVDSVVGITTLDEAVAKVLHKTKKPVTLAVNKVDNAREGEKLFQFFSLGFPKMVAVSATQSWHIAELIEAALEPLPLLMAGEAVPKGLSIAIVGRPNVGKSSLVNTLLNEPRCVVSPIAGTTRDSVDVEFSYEGHPYTLIDTAGIRRKGAEHEVVDKFAAIRTERAIERADICLLMLDATQGLTGQEKRIASQIEEQGKGCVLLFNKWDLVKGFRMEHCLQGIEQEAPFLQHCPKLFMSATTGRNLDKIFPLVQEVAAAAEHRITTGQLNKFIIGAMQRNHPPMVMGKRLRIYYMAQVGVKPPTFVLFVNYPNLLSDTYKKYLYNQFREAYHFSGVPLVMYAKGKRRANVHMHGQKVEADVEHDDGDNDSFEDNAE